VFVLRHQRRQRHNGCGWAPVKFQFAPWHDPPAPQHSICCPTSIAVTVRWRVKGGRDKPFGFFVGLMMKVMAGTGQRSAAACAVETPPTQMWMG
jgi:hypothetical protein